MHAALTSLLFAGVAGSLALALGLFVQASATEHADTQALALAVVVLVAAGSGGMLGLWSARRARSHERALETLERAAERVASGDLTADVPPPVGDRADQTFRTFDRMTRELREMRTRLAQTERETAFRDVAQRIAHEIRNPLAPIRTSIETLRKAKRRQRPDFDEIFEESTRTVLEEVQRVQRIVHDFAEFARLPKPRPGAVQLAALVRDTLSLYAPEGVDCAVVVDAVEPAAVHADREQIVQVLINLLNNAADAARVRPEARLRVSLAGGARTAVIHVDDNGPGVPQSERKRIFEPYFTTKTTGTGLGLAIAERIARDHGGSLTVTDSPLGGARFTLTLPHEAPSGS